MALEFFTKRETFAHIYEHGCAGPFLGLDGAPAVECIGVKKVD
jgi:hypothetical protein